MTTLEIILFALGKTVFLLLGFVMPLASLLTWAERRQSAMVQDRLGPNRANIGPFRAWGILHFVADALKMIFKEDFVPARAHKALFTLAPVLALAPALIVFAIVPFGDFLCVGALGARGVTDPSACAAAGGTPTFLQIAHMDIGILFY